MTHDELIKLANDLHEKCIAVLNTKGHDYTRDNDRLADFKEDAADLDITPRQAWGIKFNKQVRAMKTWARGETLKSESLESRAIDVINYATLGLALSRDK